MTQVALPPSGISGESIGDEYLTFTDRLHIIRWKASPGLCTSNYEVFRNGELIATVSANTLEYIDHNRNNQTDTYSVRAINSFGFASSFVGVTIH